MLSFLLSFKYVDGLLIDASETIVRQVFVQFNAHGSIKLKAWSLS